LTGYDVFTSINAQLADGVAKYITSEQQYIMYGSNSADILDHTNFYKAGEATVEERLIIVGGAGDDSIDSGNKSDELYWAMVMTFCIADL
jgi:hypothetical protein